MVVGYHLMVKIKVLKKISKYIGVNNALAVQSGTALRGSQNFRMFKR